MSEWKKVIPPEYRRGELYEVHSTDCGAPPVTALYLTFVAKSSGNFTFEPKNSNVIYYSTDNGTTWVQGNSVSVNAGDSVMWKSSFTTGVFGSGRFSGSTALFELKGNAMSLLYGDNFENVTTLSGKRYAFTNLFAGCTTLTNINKLTLPATTLANGCYSDMFKGCTSLTSVPSNLLPATTLANSCYSSMFGGCTGLTSIDDLVLPATTLTYGCYSSMFYGTSLTSVPSDLLPATTLAEHCYNQMFSNCTSLTSIPSGLLPATTLADFCYYQMFNGCTSLTSVPSNLLPATTLDYMCYASMFIGCTALTTAPDLPATTLTSYCYNAIFNGCSSLNYIKCLATDISSSTCTIGWVRNVASTGTFVKNASMTGWPTGNNGIPNGWTVQNAT